MYENPTPLDIEVKNSSLALAAIDEMNLVDVDITTGGSLAIASLDELNIWSTGASGNNEFTVGQILVMTLKDCSFMDKILSKLMD